MTIIDLDKRHEELYFKCLIGDPDRLTDSGEYKRRWYKVMKPRGLKVKLALNDSGAPLGMIQYLPVEESIVSGKDMYYIYCIWVINDPKFRGNHQKQGYGKALLRAVEEDAHADGKKGVIAWGLVIPVFMPAAWFRKHGYTPVERLGLQTLLWKTWDKDADKPYWITPRKKPEHVSGKTVVTCFCGGWCPEANKAFTRARRAAEAAGSDVEFLEIDTTDRRVFEEYGIADALFVNDREMRIGPAPSYKKIEHTIRKSVRRAKKGK